MAEPIEIPVDDEPEAIARWVWNNLVPKSGQSDWVQGELLRCIGKICWEAQNNGNVNWDRGFEMLADFLEQTLSDEPVFSDRERRSIREDIAVLRDFISPYTEQDLYDRLTALVVTFCRQHPSPIPRSRNAELNR